MGTKVGVLTALVIGTSACGRTGLMAGLHQGDSAEPAGCSGERHRASVDDRRLRSFIAVPGGVVVQRPTGPEGMDAEIVVFDGEGAPTWTIGHAGSDVGLLDAKGDEILYAGGSIRSSDLYRARRGQEEPEPIPAEDYAYDGAFAGPLVAWVRSIAHGSGDLTLFDGVSSRALGVIELGLGPSVSDGRIAWGKGPTIQVWSKNEIRSYEVQSNAIRYLVLGADALFYIELGHLYRSELGDDAPAILADGCRLLASDGARVAAACASGDAGVGAWSVHVFASDGETSEYPLAVGRVGALAISGRRVAFTGYSDPDVCSDRDSVASGAAYLLDPETGQTFLLGRIMKPCRSLPAFYRRPVQIALSEDMAAWRGPISAGSDPLTTVAYGSILGCRAMR